MLLATKSCRSIYMNIYQILFYFFFKKKKKYSKGNLTLIIFFKLFSTFQVVIHNIKLPNSQTNYLWEM
jgi:hypothetical protein